MCACFYFSTFRFARNNHISFCKSSTFRFAGLTASEDDKVQEEAIDISDEVREFTPVLITRPIVKKQKAAAMKRKQTAELLMTGGIEVNDLLIKVEDLSKDGENSELGGLLADWKESPPSS